MNYYNASGQMDLSDCVEEDNEDFKALMSLLKMHLIPPDEVHLMPDLFIKR